MNIATNIICQIGLPVSASLLQNDTPTSFSSKELITFQLPRNAR